MLISSLLKDLASLLTRCKLQTLLAGSNQEISLAAANFFPYSIKVNRVPLPKKPLSPDELKSKVCRRNCRII